MKEAVLYGVKEFRINETSKPRIGPNDVFIKVKASGICGSDMHSYRKGASSLKTPQKPVPGHEFSGEVSEVGSNVTKVHAGDRVGVEPLVGCGQCYFCSCGDYHLCEKLEHIGGQRKGGFAEYALIPQDKVYKLPENISYEEAALLDGFTVGVHAIHKINLTINDTVIIFGAGTVGLSLLQLVKLYNVKKVGIIGVNDTQRKMSKEFGADLFINIREENLIDKIADFTDGDGVDVVFESVGGDTSTLADSIEIIKPGGIIGVLGLFTETPKFDPILFLRKEVNILSLFSYSTWGGVSEFQIALDLLAQGKITGKGMITHRLPLVQINDGFLAMENKKESGAIKVMLIP